MIKTIQILIVIFLSFISCTNKRDDSNQPIKNSNDRSAIYSIFEGVYKSKDGIIFYVEAKDSLLIISTDSINLYKYSDSWADERVQKCNEKTIKLIEATVSNDRETIKALFGDSPIDMDDYVDNYLSMHKEVLLASPKPLKYQIENTFYVDEISNHGHEPNGWRWTTYTKIYWADGRNQIVRFNWQPKTYFIDEWGLDKPIPFKQRMTFLPRPPFRSRINVYNPKEGLTLLLREIDKKERPNSIPARFVSYNIEINQTVSVRFRILEEGIHFMEIGPIENELLIKANKITTANNG